MVAGRWEEFSKIDCERFKMVLTWNVGMMNAD